MNNLLNRTSGLIVVLNVFTGAPTFAMDYFAKEPLSPSCTKELSEYYKAEIPIKVVLVVHEDGETVGFVNVFAFFRFACPFRAKRTCSRGTVCATNTLLSGLA